MARIKRTDLYNIDPLPSTLDYVIGTDNEDSLRTKNYLIGDLLNLLSGVGAVNGIITGGVTWLQDLDFEITDLTYILGETFYAATGTTVILDAADPTDPRIDLIVVDTDGAIYSITGTPAPSPAKPVIADNTLELELTFVEIAAGATEPTGISKDLIYDENVGSPGEWDVTENTAGVRVSLGDTTQPNTGAVDIAVSSPIDAGGDTITFTSDASHAVADISTLHFYIYLVSTLATSSKIKVRFYNGATVASDIISIETGKYGLDISNTGAYQGIVLPTSEFIFSDTDITVVTFEFESFPTGTFYIDTFNLVLGVVNVAGVENFIELSDTPDTYTGQAGLGLVVNTSETALEFLGVMDTSTSQAVTGIKSFADPLHVIDQIIYNVDASVVGYASGGSSGYEAASQYYFQQDGATAIRAIFDVASLTANRTFTWQDQDGTVALLSDITGGGGMVGFDATSYTTVGTGIEEMSTITSTADLSTADGDTFHIKMSGTMTATGTKTVFMYITMDTGQQTINVTNFISITTSGEWKVTGTLTRTGATTFMYTSMGTYYTFTGPSSGSVPSTGINGTDLTWSGLSFEVIAGIASSTAAQITLENFSVEFSPAL